MKRNLLALAGATLLAIVASADASAALPRTTLARTVSPARAARAAAQAAGEIITEADGRTEIYSRSSTAIAPMGNYPADTEDYGYAGIITFGADGDVYLKNPFSQFPTGTYLHGTSDGSTITISLPQDIMDFHPEGFDESYLLKVKLLTFSDDGEEIIDAPSQTLTLTASEGGWAMTDDSVILAMVFDDGVWTGFGEMSMYYAPLDATVNTAPADARYTEWAMTYEGLGHLVDIAFAGDKCYIRGFLDTESGSLAPIVGNVTPKGISLPSPQFLGVNDDNNYLTYFYGGDIKRTYIPEYNTTVTSFLPSESLDFSLGTDGTYTSAQSAMFTPYTDLKSDYFWAMNTYETPSLAQNNVSSYVPADPSVADYMYYPSYQFGYVSFDIPMLNVDGQILDSSRLYYNIYIDDEIFTLYTDEYPLLTEDLTDIPYDFADGNGITGDIKIEGSKHTIMLYQEGIESIGVASFYEAPDGKTYYSEIVQADTAGIADVTTSDSRIASEQYHDLTGRPVAAPAKGQIYIRTVTYTDGTTKSHLVR